MTLDRRLTGWTLFAAWAATTVAFGLVRPGMTLELALVGVGGVVAWLLWTGEDTGRADGLLAAACFAAPLLNLWPLRVYDSEWSTAPAVLRALASPASLLVLAALIAGRRRIVRPPWLVVGAAVLFVLGAAVAAAAGQPHGEAAANGWVTFVIPSLFGLLVAGATRDAQQGWSRVGVVLAASVVPTAIAVSAYLLEFGFPTSATDLVLTKVALFRPHLLQDETFGNILHLADYALLLLVPALVAATTRSGRLLRVVGWVISVGSVAVLVLVLSRSGLAVGIVASFGAAIALVVSRQRAPAALPAAAMAVLLALTLTPTVRQWFAGLVPGAKTPVVAPTPNPTSSGTQNAAAEPSEAFRIAAITDSMKIFRHHTPFGVGTGEYQRYDPVRTAAHSLPLQILVEDGVFGAAGFVALVLYVLRSAIGLVRARRRRGELEQRLRIACVGGALALLLHGVIAGAALALGTASVWAMLLWLYVGILAGLDTTEHAR